MENCKNPVKEKQVTNEINQLKDAASRVFDQSIQVRERLAPVLPLGSNEEPEPAPQEVLVPMATDIRDIRTKLEITYGILDAITTRLEL